jgi:hypothetical protein
MGRKTVDLKIETEGRDKGKTFRITEMSAMRAEKWAAKALLALISSGLEIPDNIAQGGMAAVATMSPAMLQGSLAFEAVEPLLDEMMTCVQIVEDKAVRTPSEDDIDEVATLLFLRSEVLRLHTGFSMTGRISEYLARRAQPGSSNTGTSQLQ